MLKTLVSMTRAVVIVAALALMPAAAQSQELGNTLRSTSEAASKAVNNYDAYQAMAITAGVVGGAIVATVLTDGLILPVISYANGGGSVAHIVSVAGTVFGAVSGAIIGNQWYANQ
jgi:hypothetical protein